jgi:glutamate 5-kinase
MYFINQYGIRILAWVGVIYTALVGQNDQLGISELKCQNIDVVLVSSGAIAEGMKRLGWRERPENIHQLQAAAAVGQMGLVNFI